MNDIDFMAEVRKDPRHRCAGISSIEVMSAELIYKLLEVLRMPVEWRVVPYIPSLGLGDRALIDIYFNGREVRLYSIIDNQYWIDCIDFSKAKTADHEEDMRDTIMDHIKKYGITEDQETQAKHLKKFLKFLAKVGHRGVAP